jgi:hypothetical protein
MEDAGPRRWQDVLGYPCCLEQRRDLWDPVVFRRRNRWHMEPRISGAVADAAHLWSCH